MAEAMPTATASVGTVRDVIEDGTGEVILLQSDSHIGRSSRPNRVKSNGMHQAQVLSVFQLNNVMEW